MERADQQQVAVSQADQVRRRYLDLPGPKGLPFFGNAFQLAKKIQGICWRR
jgi:hypothetical protein